MKRPEDSVSIESTTGGGFGVVVDRATQYEISTSIRQPSVARFELGDESTWGPLQEVIRIGGRFSVSVNQQPRVTGRLLTRNMPLSPENGATVQLIVRTLLADAFFTACTPGIDVTNVTLKDLVVAAFQRLLDKLGLSPEDVFVFRGDLARDAITGRKSGQPSAAAGIRARLRAIESMELPAGDGGRAKELMRQRRILRQQLQGAETRPVVPDLAQVQVSEAQVHPGETIGEFVERHLARHGFMMWDAADGKIVIGHPDDSQEPLYVLASLKGEQAVANNIERCQKTEDYESVPASLWVYGQSGKKGYMRGGVKANEEDAVLGAVDPPLDRIVMVMDKGIRTEALAAARARREMVTRSMQKDAWSIEMDGLSYWSGTEAVPFAVDTVADVQIDVADRADGPYLIHECVMSGGPDSGHSTKLSTVGKGIWVL